MASNNSIVSSQSSPSSFPAIKRSSSLSPSFTALSQSMLGQHDNLAEKEATRFFQSFSVEEIRSKQAESRKDIEAKKQELRRLVGARYRDLIDSADSIIQMKQLTEELLKKIGSIENHSNSLMKKRRESLMSAPKEQISHIDSEVELRRKKYYLGKQIKFLVDTPEQIWSALECHNYLKAANLYLDAESVNKKLTKVNDDYSAKILASIPLLSRQWAIVMQFPPKILQNSRNYLLSNGISQKGYAGALCAIILLNRDSQSKILSEFLSSRLKSLHNVLVISSNRIEENSTEYVMKQLNMVVDIVQSTMYYVKTLFIDAGDNKPLIHSLLNSIINDPIYALDKSSIDLSSVRLDHIKNEASQWIHKCAGEVKLLGKQLLSKISKAKDLKKIEDSILESINRPFAPPLEKDDKTIGESPKPVQWRELSTYLLSDYVPIYATLFQEMMIERAQFIIALSFQNLSISVQLENYLHQLADENSTKIQDRNIGGYVWNYSEDEKIEITKKKTNGITTELDSLISLIDSQLLSFMEDVNHLVSISSMQANISGSNLSASMKPEIETSSSSDISKLRAFIQDTCYNTIISIAKQLQDKLVVYQNQLLQLGNGNVTTDSHDGNTFYRLDPKACQILDQAIFLGRLGKAIYTHSTQLKKILDTPSPPRNFASKDLTPLKRRSLLREKREEVSELFKKVQHELRKQYLFSHVLWANYISRTFTHTLKENINKEDWGNSARKRTWEELNLTVESDNNSSVQEKIYLPFQPSHFILSFFFSICKEIHRIGSHVVDKNVLQYLTIDLSSVLYKIYESFIQQSKNKDKEGMIQFIFDLRFIFDILSGRVSLEALQQIPELLDAISLVNDHQNVISTLKDKSEEVTKWINYPNKLLEKVESELDPIDVAFYRPHLKQATQRCYKRSTLLFGFLVQLNKLYSDIKQKPSLQEQHNVLVLAPLASRFTLLPITAPPLKTAPTDIVDTINLSVNIPNTTANSSNSSSFAQPQRQTSIVDRFSSMFVPGSSSNEKKEKKDGIGNLWFL